MLLNIALVIFQNGARNKTLNYVPLEFFDLSLIKFANFLQNLPLKYVQLTPKEVNLRRLKTPRLTARIASFKAIWSLSCLAHTKKKRSL